MQIIIRILFSGLFVLTFYSCNHLDKETEQQEGNDCKKGKLKAIKDAKNSHYEIISYGLPDYPDWNFQKFYENYVEKKYGIILGNGGCVLYEEKLCYTDKMREIVKKKFGENILIKSRKLAKIEFKRKILLEIKNDSIFTSVDTLPFFINNKENLSQYISNRLKNEKKLNGRTQVTFVVEKNGDLSNINLKPRIENKFDQKLIELLENMPNWNPGIYFGEKVRTKIEFPIILN